MPIVGHDMLRNTKTWLSSALLLVWVVLDFSPAFSQLAVRLDGIDSSSRFLVYYGNDFSADQINRISQFDVVVIDPNSPQLTPAVVADLQARGVQYVLGYLTIGISEC